MKVPHLYVGVLDSTHFHRFAAKIMATWLTMANRDGGGTTTGAAANTSGPQMAAYNLDGKSSDDDHWILKPNTSHLTLTPPGLAEGPDTPNGPNNGAG